MGNKKNYQLTGRIFYHIVPMNFKLSQDEVLYLYESCFNARVAPKIDNMDDLRQMTEDEVKAYFNTLREKCNLDKKAKLVMLLLDDINQIVESLEDVSVPHLIFVQPTQKNIRQLELYYNELGRSDFVMAVSLCVELDKGVNMLMNYKTDTVDKTEFINQLVGCLQSMDKFSLTFCEIPVPNLYIFKGINILTQILSPDWTQDLITKMIEGYNDCKDVNLPFQLIICVLSRNSFIALNSYDKENCLIASRLQLDRVVTEGTNAIKYPLVFNLTKASESRLMQLVKVPIDQRTYSQILNGIEWELYQIRDRLKSSIEHTDKRYPIAIDRPWGGYFVKNSLNFYDGICSACKKESKQLSVCDLCNRAAYCSNKCRDDNNEVHRDKCLQYQKKVEFYDSVENKASPHTPIHYITTNDNLGSEEENELMQEISSNIKSSN